MIKYKLKNKVTGEVFNCTRYIGEFSFFYLTKLDWKRFPFYLDDTEEIRKVVIFDEDYWRDRQDYRSVVATEVGYFPGIPHAEAFEITSYENTKTLRVEIKTRRFNPISEDYVIRELATKLVNEMTIDQIKQVFNYQKLNPFTRECEELIRNEEISEAQIETIKHLIAEQSVAHSLTIKVEED